MNCTRCNKRLSRKTARLIDGKPMCNACLFPRTVKGYPPNDTIMPDMLASLGQLVGREITSESWNQDTNGNWHFYLNGEEQTDPDGSRAAMAE